MSLVKLRRDPARRERERGEREKKKKCLGLAGRGGMLPCLVPRNWLAVGLAALKSAPRLKAGSDLAASLSLFI